MVISWNGYTLWMSVFFSQFVNRLVQFYPEIYDGGGAESQFQINFAKKWKSYSSIYELAKGDITKFDEVIDLPLEKCLLYLCYAADKNSLEAMMHNEAMKKGRS